MEQKRKLIAKPVGNGLDNDENDVIAVQRELYERGYLNQNPHDGIINAGTSLAIKNYQKDRNLKVDGMLNPGGETENSLIHSLNESAFHKDLNAARSTDVLKNLKRFSFVVRDNPKASVTKPWYENSSASQVKQYEKIIEKVAKDKNMDADLIKSIMHMETTRGWYDGMGESLGLNKTVRPMNINPELWGELLGYSRSDIEDPEKNIRAGAELLGRIAQRVPDRSIARIATLYNYLPARSVNDYGVKVEDIYKNKPWKNRR